MWTGICVCILQRQARIQEENEVDQSVVNLIATKVPGVDKTDIHKILREFSTAATS